MTSVKLREFSKALLPIFKTSESTTFSILLSEAKTSSPISVIPSGTTTTEDFPLYPTRTLPSVSKQRLKSVPAPSKALSATPLKGFPSTETSLVQPAKALSPINSSEIGKLMSVISSQPLKASSRIAKRLFAIEKSIEDIYFDCEKAS